MAEIEVNEDDRVYSKRHLWAQLDRENMIAYVGITDFLAEQLAEIVSIDLPMPGDEVDVDTMLIHLHLRNRIHHLRLPLTGRVTEVNKEVLDNCSLVHLDPNTYWLLAMEYDDEDELDLLMDAEQYSEYVDLL